MHDRTHVAQQPCPVPRAGADLDKRGEGGADLQGAFVGDCPRVFLLGFFIFSFEEVSSSLRV
jgi:hypothetical protein